MQQFTILSLLLLALVASQATAGTIKQVSVTLGGGSDAKVMFFEELDEGMTIRKLAERCMDEWGVACSLSKVRMEGHLGMTYNHEKTLKEAGIKDNSRIKLKYWSRAGDLGSMLLGTRYSTN